MKYSLVFLVLIACSHVNKESDTHFDEAKKMRHGIIPFSFNRNTDIVKFDSKSAKRGKKVYEKNCLSCHGKSGEGDGPMADDVRRPKNLKTVFKHVPSFQFFMKVSQMSGGMPGWKSYFSDQDLRDLAQYLRSLSIK